MIDVHAKISELQKSIKQLDSKFTLYFIGKEKIPPLRELEQLNKAVFSLIKKEDGHRAVRVQFLIDNVVQSFTIYKRKWEKSLKDIEEGRKKRGTNFFGKHVKEKSSTAGISADMTREIESAVDEYVRAAKKYFKKTVNKEEVKQQIKDEMQKVVEKFGDNFFLDVCCDEKKKITIKAIKK